MMRATAVVLLVLQAVLAEGTERSPVEAQKPFFGRPGLQMFLGDIEPSVGSFEIVEPTTHTEIYLQPRAVIDSGDVAVARATTNQSGQAAVAIEFRADSGQKIKRVTSSNWGKRLAIFIDGKLVLAPVLRETFQSHAMLNGRFSAEKCNELADAINRAVKTQSVE